MQVVAQQEHGDTHCYFCCPLRFSTLPLSSLKLPPSCACHTAKIVPSLFLLIQNSQFSKATCTLWPFSFSSAKQLLTFFELARYLVPAPGRWPRYRQLKRRFWFPRFKAATWNNTRAKDDFGSETLLRVQLRHKQHAKKDERVQWRSEEVLWKQTALKWRNSNLPFLWGLMSSLTQFFLFLPRSPLCTTGEMVVSVVSHPYEMFWEWLWSTTLQPTIGFWEQLAGVKR